MPVQAHAIVALPGESGFHLREVAPPNVWVLPELHCLIDTGLPTPTVLADILSAIAAWPSLNVLVTHNHPDHVGNLAALVEARPDAALWGPASVAMLSHAIRERITLTAEGALIGTTGLIALATPGHTEDHMAYWLPDDFLAAGDLILGEGTPWVGPPEGDLGDYLHSLDRVARMPDTLRLLGGHGPERPSAPAIARATHAHRMLRERMVLEVWATGIQDPRAIATEIYETREKLNLDPMRFEMAVWTITGHIEYSRRRGLL